MTATFAMAGEMILNRVYYSGFWIGIIVSGWIFGSLEYLASLAGFQYLSNTNPHHRFINLHSNVSGPNSPAWNSRLTSTYPVCWISITALLFLYLGSPSDFNSNPSLVMWHFSLGMSCGYLIYDLLIVLILLDSNKTTILHHLVVAFGIYWLRWKYPVYVAIGSLSEISTPFLNFCWFLLHSELASEHKCQLSFVQRLPFTSPNLFQLSSILLLLTFFVFRVLVSPYLLYISFCEQEYRGIPACLILTFLNITWFIQLVQKGRQLNKTDSD